MNNKKKFYIFVVLLSVLACLIWIIVLKGGYQMKKMYGSISQEVIEVSIINLIATPEKYDGMLVRVIGVVNFGFEDNGLFFSHEDYKKSITKNAIRIEMSSSPLNTEYHMFSKFNGKYVIIEGIFSSQRKGNLDSYSGTIKKMSRIGKWE